MSLDQNERVKGWRVGGVGGSEAAEEKYISPDSGKEQQESQIKRGLAS